MKNIVIRMGIAVAMSLVALSPTWAEDAKKGSALDLWIGNNDTSDSRKDVPEVTRPLLPSGPATPASYCNPSTIDCS